MVKYGLNWADDWTPLQIEMSMIQSGGYRIVSGKRFGGGLPVHYEEMRKILWPRLDDHRWHRLCRDEILKNKVTVLLGPGSSGKTHEASWVYLVEYLCFPDETCVLVSSTDLRGLRLRVWGEITMLWQEAIDRAPHLPGHLLESRIAITTDEMPDTDYSDRKVRDMRKGIVGIPTVQGGKFVGLGKWIGIKQKRVRLIADEACFPAGTLVSCLGRRVPIEAVKPGDYVDNALGSCLVNQTTRRRVNKLVAVVTRDGRKIVCTPTHPFFTQQGWKCACELDQSCYMIGLYESMQILRKPNQEQNFLQSALWREVGNHIRKREKSILHATSCNEDCDCKPSTITRQSSELRVFLSGCEIFDEKPREQKKGIEYTQTNWTQAEDSRREWNRTYASRKVSHGNVPSTLPIQLSSKNGKAPGERVSSTLQGRCGSPRVEACDRSGWAVSSAPITQGAGCEEIQPVDGTWVDRVEILEPKDIRGYSEREGGIEVYNLEIASHPSYSVNGLLVHNSAMGASFLSAFANLNKNEDFKAVIIGNPNDPLDPLGKAAEPLDGWTGHLQPEKTEVWKTRFMGGSCVNLIGTDSPNFDFPAEQPTRYKYLISREKIADTLSFFPKDSFEYYSQCVGCMKVGTLDDRIITRDLCRNYGAMEDVVWQGGEITKVCALDSAYGGDRAVCGHIEFGPSVGGHVVLAFNPPQIVPVNVNSASSPEEQLALWVRDYCERNEILPANFFHDSTGRGGLGTAIARVWSAECNPVEFGGAATDRPVALGLYTFDMDTQSRRLTRCDEHYDRLVSELWYQFRYAIESRQVRRLPEDVMDELCMRKWERVHRNNRITIETKQKMKERVGRSPDLGDWAALCLEGARRLGFVIEKLPDDGKGAKQGVDYLQTALRTYRMSAKKRELHYTT